MYCTHCGAQAAEGTKFCAQCGATVTGAAASSESGKGTGKLTRPWADRKIAGVCAAFAQAYGWDVTWVRIFTVLLALCGCGGLLAYVIACVCIPNEPKSVPVPPTANAT
jgi:phage shock protein PspC (stress-responsive transcriptional regulator)